MRNLLAAALVAFCVSSSAQVSFAPESRAHVAAEEVWLGSVTVFIDFGVYSESLVGGVKFSYVNTIGIEDHYRITGGSVTWTASGADEDCVYGGGPITIFLSESNTDGEMLVYPDGRYTINSWMLSSPGNIQVDCDPGGSFELPGQLASLIAAPPFYNITEGGTRMEGNYGVGTISYAWNLTSRPPELEVEPTGYDDWLPNAGLDEKTPGPEDLTIQARVLKGDGSPLGRPADKFRFELAEVSRVPGVAINFPRPERATDDFDLAFVPAHNPDAEKIDDVSGQWIEMPSAEETSVALSAFDWGAFGLIKVTAIVDGFEVVGYVKGDKNKTEVLVPKRDRSSQIADVWKAANEATGKPDGDDTDAMPEGDGHTGDGLTLYEEYRGFIEKGQHSDGDPGVKDFFIYDEVGGRSKQGIGMFIRSTRLNVHHELLDSEFPANRVINANAGDPDHTDQTGIHLVRGADNLWSYANGGPGLPRQIFDVTMARTVISSPDRLVTIRNGGQTVRVDRYAQIFTHELGHTVNIWHHGDIDQEPTWEVKKNSGSIVRDTSGVAIVLEDGSLEITLWTEVANRATPLWLQASGKAEKVWVGWPEGQHSGDELCFMRYFIANSYGWYGDTRFVIRINEFGTAEPPASRFCSSAVGTGKNAPSRSPRPRFGNASSSAEVGPAQRGDCVHRICVKDSNPDH